jgi:hypothetical protein
MGCTSGAVELELERREGRATGLGLSSKSQLGTHWLILGGVASKTVVLFLCVGSEGELEHKYTIFPSFFGLFFTFKATIMSLEARERERERFWSTGREYRK